MEIKTLDFCYKVNRGLNEDQVRRLRDKYGSNELTPPKKEPWWKKLLGSFEDPTIRILLAAAVLSLAVTAVERIVLKNQDANYFDSVGIFIAVGLATLVGYFSERKSAREFELLNRVKENILVKVFRNGQMTQVGIGELVVGDLVHIDSGDKIPADGVVLQEMGLFIDQSMLTGESLPVEKMVYRGPFDLEAMVSSVTADEPLFIGRGCMAVDGTGLLLVTAVGDRTEMGKIAKALEEEKDSAGETPLVQKLARLAKQISVAGVVAAMTIFSVMAMAAVSNTPLLGLMRENHGGLVVLAAVSVAVGWLIERFCLKPFFAGMDMELTSKRMAVFATLPMILAAFVVGLGIWGFTCGSPETMAGGVELLKETLLAFVIAVTIIVVAVPEGLPMMVTMSLALNMMKMVRENCLVRRLIASETIGSATVICTDKTGTLTENKMKPLQVWLDGQIFYRDKFRELTENGSWTDLETGISVNSEANLHVEKDGSGKEQVSGIGNPTECALLGFLHELDSDYNSVRARFPKLFEQGHNSQRKYSLAVAETGGKKICYIKGAPEKILARCSTVLLNGRAVSITQQRSAIENMLRTASDNGLRVLAFCEKEIDGFDSDRAEAAKFCEDLNDCCFVGFVGLADPVRKDVPAAIESCRNAHIQVKMITGDSLSTAVAIAKEAGIYSGENGEMAMTSEEFAKISDDELPEAAKKICVLARSTPLDKMRLVKALHQKGEVVAMTGDGTNDAPALKSADVGLSMGANGTEVAKEASDIVLVDDNFKSIVTGVWWGRTLFQNIQRFVQFQLSVNAVALLCAIVGPLLGVPLPLTVTQLLWINIIMDTFAALALSTEPPRPKTMTEHPIPRNASIITKTMGITILTVSLYQLVILFAGLFFGWFVDPAHRYNASIPVSDPEYLTHNLQALTVFFTVFVMFQFWHKFNCRALTYDDSVFRFLTKNKPFIFIVTAITVVQIVMVQIPVVGEFFRTEPLNLKQWIGIFLVTATIIPVAKIGRKLAEAFGGA